MTTAGVGRSAPVAAVLCVLLGALAVSPGAAAPDEPPRLRPGAALSAPPVRTFHSVVAQADRFPARPTDGGRLVAYRPSHAPARPASGWSSTVRTGRTGFEPTLGFDADGSLFVVGFRPGLPGLAEAPVYRSDDRGVTWEEVSPWDPDDPARHEHLVTNDPYLHVDRGTGRVFSADFWGVPTLQCFYVSWTDDKGETWDSSAPCGLGDHQSLFTGPPVTSTTSGYENIVYLCSQGGGVLTGSPVTACLKSLDGGATWMQTGQPAFTDDPAQEEGFFGIRGHCAGVAGHGATDAQGTIYLPRGWCLQPMLAVSRDEGASWSRMRVPGPLMGKDACGFHEHEAAAGVDADGNIYYLWVADDGLPYLSRFDADDDEWLERPLMVAAPGVTMASLPTLAVGETGGIAIGYVGTDDAEFLRPAPGECGETATTGAPGYADAAWDAYIAVARQPENVRSLFYTATLNDPEDPVARGYCGPGSAYCAGVGDFIDITIDPDGVAWLTAVDAAPQDDESLAGELLVGMLRNVPRLR